MTHLRCSVIDLEVVAEANRARQCFRSAVADARATVTYANQQENQSDCFGGKPHDIDYKNDEVLLIM